MKTPSKKIIGSLFIATLFLFMAAGFVSADVIKMPTGNEIVPIVRGDNPGYLMDDGKMYTIYYVADGKTATIKYSESFGSYFFGKRNNENSLIAMNIYYAPWFDKPYTLVKKTGIDLFTQKTSLSKTEGVYKFEFKSYGHNWAAVNFKVY